ncbi:MAG: hypothetical protein IAE94_04975 [Chthoniobacterales bacterium]|nr:hypothetical protein [Chthoniobacterales bacterium]
MSDRSKTAYYRRCYLNDDKNADASGGKTLQKLISEAVKIKSAPWKRALGAGGSDIQLLSVLVNKSSCLCGELAYYQKERHIPLIDHDEKGVVWQGNVEPLDSEGKKRNLKENALYFAIRENHVAVIQSMAVDTQKLSEFLTWLIQSEAKLAPLALIALKNLPSRHALEKLKDHNIRGVRFKDRLLTKVKEEVPLEPGEPPRKRRKLVHTIKQSPMVFNILAQLGLSEAILEKLQSESDPGAIDVEVEISYRSKKEKEGLQTVRALAEVFGAQEGLECTIQLDGKSKIQGADLTISDSISVQCPQGNVSVDDALSKLAKWLMEQIQAGKIP